MPIVAFSRWDPLRDLIALHEQIGQLVGTDAPGWTPAVDLYETATEFILTADLPGLSRDQIDVTVDDNRVVIRGERVGKPMALGLIRNARLDSVEVTPTERNMDSRDT